MSGSAAGGKKAAATNKQKYGDDFYKMIGRKSHAAWVANGRKPRGFSYDPRLAVEAVKKRWADGVKDE